MKLEKADGNIDRIQERIIYYQTKTEAELKAIQPRWAYGLTADKLQDYSLHPNQKEYNIHLIDVACLANHVNWYGFILRPLFTGEFLNDHRIAGLLSHWEMGGFVDPPVIGRCNQVRGKLSISDGRHRTKLTLHLGHQQIPVAVHVSDIPALREICWI